MGFYPVMKCELRRDTVKGERVVVARWYDDVLAKWEEQTINGWSQTSFDLAWERCRSALMQLEM
jgi:hypothetical protein